MEKVRTNEYKPDYVLPPGDTILETIESIGMTPAQLSHRMGETEKHINEVIKGKAVLTEDIALKLEVVLGIDASFWRNLEQMYRRYS
ncbi:helix-turn-helix transcriptional regulator [Desulfonatronovibrio magnus]|uniref:helix-turn-helix transcriptional regulator n=1 Tax=Desulfonatronovibrio magnus TaxID=698827 RepID=UPI0005EB3097|nr:helix-turn-helix domain-containing protein [Desulfonatronovibrio magnus]